MKNSFLICLLAIMTCALATPPLQAANTASGKPGHSHMAGKNKKKHHKHKKHKK